jgi:hypothetical protein
MQSQIAELSTGGDCKLGDPLTQTTTRYYPIVLVPFVVIILGLSGVTIHSPILGVRLLFDEHDISVYFRSSRWIFGEGTLFRDVASEYPLLANLVFGTWRCVASAVNRDQLTFEYVWVVSASVLYLYAVCRVASETSRLATITWLAPAPIYFALLRYDIYPATATLLAMLAIRRDAYIAGAFWLGIAAALKGYALCLLPAYFVFIFCRRDLKAAISCAAIVIGPMLLCLLASFIFAGWEGMLAPFRLQAGREFNGESLYDAVNYLLVSQVKAKEIPLLPLLLQLSSALIAAAMCPRKFQDLVNAFLFAVLGFITFSPFYSPQFVLWILPLVAFSDQRAMLISAIGFSWLTYFYFPIVYDLTKHRPGLAQMPFQAVVVATTALRLLMMGLAIKHSGKKLQ